MGDVQYLHKSKSSGDFRIPFSPAGTLIDLSRYGIRPVKTQDLSVLKEHVKALVLNGEERMNTPPSVTTRGNIVVHRRGLDKFHFLLNLSGAMEKGQTTEICFPEVSRLMRSRFYRGSSFQRRHLITEAFALLSRDDLKSMRSFLEDELFDAIGYAAALPSFSENGAASSGSTGAAGATSEFQTVGSVTANNDGLNTATATATVEVAPESKPSGSVAGDDAAAASVAGGVVDSLSVAAGAVVSSKNMGDIVKVCAARRRLHWITVRLEFALDDSQEISDKLYFGPLTFQKDQVYKNFPLSLVDDMKKAVAEEVKNEMAWAIDLDCVCAPELRKAWCGLAEQSFDKFTDCVLKYYTFSDDAKPDEMLEKLQSCLTETLSTPISSDRVEEFAMGYCDSPTFSDSVKTGSSSIRAALTKIHDDSSTADAISLGETRRPGLMDYIACRANHGSEDPGIEASRSESVCIKPWNVVENLREEIEEPWYRQLQWDVAMVVVALSGSLLGGPERPNFMNERVLYELKQLAIKETGLDDLKDPVMGCLEPVHMPAAVGDCERPPEPHSFPFFLCLVWPGLRKLGWRLDAGSTPDSVSFVAPERLASSRANSAWKQKRDLIRARLAREANRTGLGQVSKLTKRLIVALVPHPSSDDAVKAVLEPASSKGVNAKLALRLFYNNIVNDLENNDSKARVLAKKIVDALLECFQEVAPRLSGASNTGVPPAGLSSLSTTSPIDDSSGMIDATDQTDEAKTENLSSGTNTANATDDSPDGCDHLLRLLLVLPSILRQSDLPLQEINDSLEVVQEVADFITSQHASLFNKEFHPPRERTAKENKSTKPALAARLQAAAMASSSLSEKQDGADGKKAGQASAITTMTEVVREEDKANLTDFVVAVLEQAIPCRATEKDVTKKFRRIHVGYPGFVCRHCQGSAGEGRYFFTTIESLTTASTVFEKHVLKCPAVPPSIKSGVLAMKSRHIDQRKTLPSGAQQQFFNRLWDRLRSSKIEGVASGLYILEAYSKKGSDGGTAGGDSNDGDGGTSDQPEFRDHVELLDFVRNTSPWKSQNFVLEGLNQYYNCIEYGGRIYGTASAPEHFTSEWLLAKVAPRTRDSDLMKKKRMMPG